MKVLSPSAARLLVPAVIGITFLAGVIFAAVGGLPGWLIGVEACTGLIATFWAFRRSAAVRPRRGIFRPVLKAGIIYLAGVAFGFAQYGWSGFTAAVGLYSLAIGLFLIWFAFWRGQGIDGE